MLSYFLFLFMWNWASVYSQDLNGYGAVPMAESTMAERSTPIMPDGFCPGKCAESLQEDINIVIGKNGNLNDISRLQDLLKSPMAFTSNQSDTIVQICKHGYKNFKPCLTGCPKSDDIDIMLISLRPLDYICRDHLKEFVDALPCITNVSTNSMENECKPIVDKIMNLLNETLIRASSSSKHMSLDDTVNLIDTSCWYGYEFLKCMQPNLVEKCGTNVEKLILDTFDIATDTVIRIVTYLKTSLLKKANITLESIAVKCQKAKNIVELMIGQAKKTGNSHV